MHDNESAQQWLAILLAAKSDKEQSFVDTTNRGGLWKVNEEAVNIFMACEREFYFSVQECTINKIDAKAMVEVLMKNSLIKVDFTQLCVMTEVNVDKEVSHNLPEKLIRLFISVRSHAYARKIKEMNKKADNLNKAKPLRTEIKKKSSNLEKGH